MKYYFYKTTNRINGKYYYGVHSSSTKTGEDSYLGSGTLLWKAIKKYGKENFSKEILVEFDSAEEAYRYEAEHITEVEVKDPNCYNVQLGGRGGPGGTIFLHRGEEMIKVLPDQVEEFLEKGWEQGKSEVALQKAYRSKLSEEHKRKISEALKGKPSPLRGTHISEEHKQKVSKARKGKSNYWALGVPRSEETKKKISEALKGPHAEWRRKINSECHKGLPGTITGRISVWKEGHKRYIKQEDIQNFLDKGYFRTKKESIKYGRQ